MFFISSIQVLLFSNLIVDGNMRNLQENAKIKKAIEETFGDAQQHQALQVRYLPGHFQAAHQLDEAQEQT